MHEDLHWGKSLSSPKFKVGDRVIYIGKNTYYMKDVATVIGYTNFLKPMLVHENYDYDDEEDDTNYHSSYPDSEFELEQVVISPLYEELK